MSQMADKGKKLIAQAMATEVTQTGKTGTEQTKEYPVGEPKTFDKLPCVVGMSMGATRNLGNYQSARVDVTLLVPCEHSEVNDVADFVKGWVEERMNGLVSEIDSAAGA